MRTPEDTPTDADQLIRFGSIASVDLGAGRCVIQLDDESETPPIRWFEARSGKTRTWSPPSKGEQVLVFCPAGEIGAAVALRGLSSDEFPAAGNSLAELIKFDDGAVFSYDPQAHVLSYVLPAGGKFVVVADKIDLTGEVALNGKMTATVDVVADGISLKNHKTSGVSAGTALSGGPV